VSIAPRDRLSAKKYTESNLSSITGVESGINPRSGESFDFSSCVHRTFGGFDYGVRVHSCFCYRQGR
jgi:hypothetical protein